MICYAQMHHLWSERQTSSARLLMSSLATAYLGKHFAHHLNGLPFISNLHAGIKKKKKKVSRSRHKNFTREASIFITFPTFPWLIARPPLLSAAQHSSIFSRNVFFTWQGRAKINQRHAALMLSAYFATALTHKVHVAAAGGGGILDGRMNFLPQFWRRGASIIHIL